MPNVFANAFPATGGIAPPPPPGMCNVHCFINLNDQPIENAVVTAKLVSKNSAADDIVLSKTIDVAVTDINGYALLVLVYGSSFVEGDGIYNIQVWVKDCVTTDIKVIIPDQTDINLQDLIALDIPDTA